MKKIVSIALFGEKYSHFLPSFVRAHLNVFPIAEGWVLRVHIDNIVAASPWKTFLDKLAYTGLVDTICMGTAPLSKASLWRMAPVFDPEVDYVFCRDIDAIPMPRDRVCCDEFMASGSVTHTIHDHEQHVNIMAGLCGFEARRFRQETKLASLDDLYAAARRTDDQWLDKETDQHVLNALLLTREAPHLFEHRYNGWFDGPCNRPSRLPGTYPGRFESKPTPNYGSAQYANYLGPHLGCASYDYEAASRFWDENGSKNIARAIKDCERAAEL